VPGGHNQLQVGRIGLVDDLAAREAPSPLRFWVNTSSTVNTHCYRALHSGS
jgi:hypothetical protein